MNENIIELKYLLFFTSVVRHKGKQQIKMFFGLKNIPIVKFFLLAKTLNVVRFSWKRTYIEQSGSQGQINRVAAPYV